MLPRRRGPAGDKERKRSGQRVRPWAALSRISCFRIARSSRHNANEIAANRAIRPNPKSRRHSHSVAKSANGMLHRTPPLCSAPSRTTIPTAGTPIAAVRTRKRGTGKRGASSWLNPRQPLRRKHARREKLLGQVALPPADASPGACRGGSGGGKSTRR